jgi:hypothetical protein
MYTSCIPLTITHLMLKIVSQAFRGTVEGFWLTLYWQIGKPGETKNGNSVREILH